VILGLPINDTPVCGMVSSTWWRESVREVISIQPPDIPVDQKDKKMTGMYSRWLTTQFNTCPGGVDDAVVQRYILSCVWHMDDV
jgi:hypothetical protein